MEESDGMLITTLREHIAMPRHVESFKDISAEEVSLIGVSLLQHPKVDVGEVRALSGKSQRFRAMAKLNQLLHQQL